MQGIDYGLWIGRAIFDSPILQTDVEFTSIIDFEPFGLTQFRIRQVENFVDNCYILTNYDVDILTVVGRLIVGISAYLATNLQNSQGIADWVCLKNMRLA